MILAPFSRPFSMMAKPVGARCNLACTYCYYLEKASLNKGGSVMDDKMLETFIRQYIEAQTVPFVQFTWHGGEPLMRNIRFFKLALELQKRYGCRPSDLYAAIGPSVCADCYEVSEDVAVRARDALWKLPAKKGFADFDVPGEAHSGSILRQGKEEGKYLLDLHALNREMLLASGIPDTHIFITDICTCCNPELLFSHRVQGEPRGNLAAFLTLRQGKSLKKTKQENSVRHFLL